MIIEIVYVYLYRIERHISAKDRRAVCQFIQL